MRKWAIAMLAAAGAMPASAATQGAAAQRSTGSILITLSVAAQARLSEMADRACVALNTATQGFDVTAEPAADAVPLARCGSATQASLIHPQADGTLIVAPE